MLDRTRNLTRKALVSMLTLTLAVGTARADLRVLLAEQDPQVVSSFTLDFGDLGGISSAEITTTDMGLALESVQSEARIASYFQNVDSLTLPGNIETGPITVAIVTGSSHGSYNPQTSEFTTSELYLITFTNDLSMFGLESPVMLPGESVGRIEGPPGDQKLVMTWEGEGQIQNPADPQNPINFSYACSVNTIVTSRIAAGDLNCDGLRDAGDIEPFFHAIANPVQYAADFPGCDAIIGDMNGDGVFDGADIDPFFACLVGDDCP